MTCKTCGQSDMLVPDPSGYYGDASTEEGLLFACRWCRDPNHPTVVEARNKKQKAPEGMREQLMSFLKRLEEEIPPAPKCHHAMTFARYGSDDTGWAEQLAIQVNDSGRFYTFFLDEGDLEAPEATIAEIVRGIR